MEKFKFVLNHKIKELKRDIGPREEEIVKMKKVLLNDFLILFFIYSIFFYFFTKQTNNMDITLKMLNNMNTHYGSLVDELDTNLEQLKS